MGTKAAIHLMVYDAPVLVSPAVAGMSKWEPCLTRRSSIFLLYNSGTR